MAGGASLVDLHQDSVAITVKLHAQKPLGVAGRLAFLPQALAAARKIRHQARRERLLNGRTVHPSQHEHLT